MPNNSSPEQAPDLLQAGLAAISNCQYDLAYECFKQAVDEYEKSNQSRDSIMYYGLRFFKDFSYALKWLGKKGGQTHSPRFFSSALIWTKKLPPELAKDFTPTVDFFSRMMPLDERLRGLFAHPQSFEHLSEGLSLILEPLSEILSDSYLAETLPQVRTLVTARTNMCMVILYLLGKLPPETLSAVVRDDTPRPFGTPLFHPAPETVRGKRGDEPPELVQWILNQEERALMETGCDNFHQLLPAVSHFSREMVRLGAPERLDEIPEIARQRLLSLLAPLRELDISAGTILEPVMKRFFREHETRLAELLKLKAPEEKEVYHAVVQFPVTTGRQWVDLLLVIFLKAQRIEAVLGNIRRKFTFMELGLVNRRSGKVNSLGQTLVLLAEAKGILSWHTAGADKRMKLRIYRLANLLKSIFPGLGGTPFYPYQQYKAYKTRFKMEVDYTDEAYTTEDDGHEHPSPGLRQDRFNRDADIEDTDTSFNKDASDEEDPENP